MAEKLKLTFHGGTRTVTGANFLMELPGETPVRILVDCGLFQGRRICETVNCDEFPYDPKTIDYLFVTHAHLDHTGRIPRLVKAGFRGRIYSTPPTKDISHEMLMDSIHVLRKESEEERSELVYDERDVLNALELWDTAEYGKTFSIKEFAVTLKDAGHILGSAMVEFVHGGTKIVFTGDLGNSPAPLLKDTESVTDATYLIMESVYGDRDHETRDDRRRELEDAIEETVNRGGALMVPAFSLERTQELLYEIKIMMEQSMIPLVPVFLDSPLAIRVTKLYEKYDDYFNKRVDAAVPSGKDVFKFPQLIHTLMTEESKRINDVPNPKIIIAGSGMSNGGRILHHEKRYLPDKKSTLLLMGYQVPGSLGRELQDGASNVKIMGEEVPVRATVKNIRGYSAHKDMTGLIEFARQTADNVQRVFVVMGEPKSSLFLTQRLRDYLGINAHAPDINETVELELY